MAVSQTTAFWLSPFYCLWTYDRTKCFPITKSFALMRLENCSSFPTLYERYSDSPRAVRCRDRIPLGARLPHIFRPTLEVTQLPVQRVPGNILGGKAARAWRWPLFHLALKLEKEKSYTSSYLWAFMACSRVKLILYLIIRKPLVYSVDISQRLHCEELDLRAANSVISND